MAGLVPATHVFRRRERPEESCRVKKALRLSLCDHSRCCLASSLRRRCVDGRVKPGHDRKPNGASRLPTSNGIKTDIFLSGRLNLVYGVLLKGIRSRADRQTEVTEARIVEMISDLPTARAQRRDGFTPVGPYRGQANAEENFFVAPILAGSERRQTLILRCDAEHRVSKDGPARPLGCGSGSVLRAASRRLEARGDWEGIFMAILHLT
jgi:hypothetical protein